MQFYGLLDYEIAEVVEFYATKSDAERDLAVILGDEPEWRDKFEIIEVDFSGAEVEVRPMARR